MTAYVTVDEGLVDDPILTGLIADARAQLASEGIKLWVAVGKDPGGAGHAGTHDKGGVVDLHGSSRTWAQCVRTAEVFRQRGCAAWARGAAHGGMIQHIHAVVVGHPDLSPAAQKQAQAYLDGYDGLNAGKDFRGGPDYHTRKYVGVRWRGLPTAYSSSSGGSTLSPAGPLPRLYRGMDGGDAGKRLKARLATDYPAVDPSNGWVGDDTWKAMQAVARKAGLLSVGEALSVWGPKCWAAAGF